MYCCYCYAMAGGFDGAAPVGLEAVFSKIASRQSKTPAYKITYTALNTCRFKSLHESCYWTLRAVFKVLSLCLSDWPVTWKPDAAFPLLTGSH